MNSKDNKVVIGIDTSNYTTSLGIADLNGHVIENIKIPLSVKEGERGLRQADALFLHTKNFPEIMRKFRDVSKDMQPVAVGVSEKPRNAEDSYMPCFLAGVSVAESISAVCKIPLYRFSHQCNHIMAAVYSANATEIATDTFAAYHISGGTTELVLVKPEKEAFVTEKIGGTLDLNCGQLIDRVGIMLGMRFPAGAELEKHASANTEKVHPSTSVDGMWANFSGLENMSEQMIRNGKSKEYISSFILESVAKSIDKITACFVGKYGNIPIVFAGGVMSNRIIRKKLSGKYNAYFAEPQFSCDNAAGTALLAARAFTESQEK